MQIFKGSVGKRAPVISAAAFDRSPARVNVQSMRIFTSLNHTNVKKLRLVEAADGEI